MSKIPEVKIGINHQPIKEYNERDNANSRIVHMNNGDNFEILLYNPLDVTVGVSVELNGNLLTNSRLILYPGQSFWLDGHPETHKKFHFTEYTVDVNKPNMDAIANNGKIKIEFYKEIKEYKTIQFNKPYRWYPNYYENPFNTPDINWDFYNVNNTGGTNKVGTLRNDVTQTQFYCSTMASNNQLVDMSDGHACMDALYNDVELSKSSAPKQDVTGRIDFKGDSNQRFSDIEIDLESFPSYTSYYRILPKSKQILATEIKNYCSKCGRRARKGEIYCPSCGNKL